MDRPIDGGAGEAGRIWTGSGRTIWKFTLDPSHVYLKMPRGARLIHAHEQGGGICVWAEVDPAAPLHARYVHIIPTGAEPFGDYVGTAHLQAGVFVFHVYDGGEGGPV